MGIINPSFFFRRWGVAMVTDFWRQSAKIGIPHLHSVRWHSTTDGRIATRMRALTPPMTPSSDKNYVNFGPVIPEFCRRVSPGGLHAGLCHAFLVSFAMSKTGMCITGWCSVATTWCRQCKGAVNKWSWPSSCHVDNTRLCLHFRSYWVGHCWILHRDNTQQLHRCAIARPTMHCRLRTSFSVECINVKNCTV